MTRPCLVCLREAPEGSDYHPRCVRQLFGVTRPPRIDLELAKMHTLAQATVGHSSISGTQRKISVKLTADRATLQVAIEGGDFILKPQTQAFPHLPENEHVTMRIAREAGLEVPSFGLVHLHDGSLAYLIRRFDCVATGKLLQEDFCQLAGLSPKQKYEGSAELCARLLAKFATEPGIESLKLLRLVAFAWWTGNGDLHLKNLSLLRGTDGSHRLSPAYDLVSTLLVIEHDQLALPVGGNRKRVTARQWCEFADYCQVPPRAAARVLRSVAGALEAALSLVESSLLPEAMQRSYSEVLRERAKPLSEAAARAARAGMPR
jgi:serine/threonine-protein kinase HipA